MAITRRSFLKSCVAAGAAGSFSIPARAEAGPGDAYPGWKPGDLDLHFVYTGCGENMFYRLPDGTAILNDTGEFYRPRDLEQIPLLPSPERLGGEWMSRYVQRVYPEKTIDYLMFSHWHGDHIGHADYDKPETPGAAYRYKTLADGTRVNGFLCVAQDFNFKRCFDHQYPERGTYLSQGSAMALLDSWQTPQRKKSLICEPFKVGALNQIALQRDPGMYPGFSIRNINANGRLWDGKDGVIDCVGEYAARTGRKRIPQNVLSLGFVMQYGKFRFWSGGDTSSIPAPKKSKNNDQGLAFEGMVGSRVGPVTLCKMNHHGCGDAMSEAFVRSVRAQAYVSCIWAPGQIVAPTLERMASREIHHGYDPLIMPNNMPQAKIDAFKGQGFLKNVVTRGPAHVVVKVLPGGSEYRVYLLEAHDESMKILSRFDRRT